MKTLVHVLVVSLLAVISVSAQTKAPGSNSAVGSESAAKLPVRRVVLYKNGVGYFEHLGRVHGSQDVHIDFTSAQLNDALKSLTVLDLSGGRITGVDYNSEAPLARRLATLRLALGERPTRAGFLGALRGARLEVHSGAAPAIAGTLLSVESRARTSINGTVQMDELHLLTDSGELRSADLGANTSVRIVDREMRIEAGRYLNLLASARDQDLRRMAISTSGNGDRNLYVSYISEVPLWKTTYRIVLPDKADKKPLLQGWAIVDNTIGEDWNDVELSLVAGAPHSFIQELSQAYYARRPEVPLPESIELTPQTHAATLEPGAARITGEVTDQNGESVSGAKVQVLDTNDQVIAETASNDEGEYSLDNLPVGDYRLNINKPGFQTTQINLQTHSGTNTQDATISVGSVSQTVAVEAATASRSPRGLRRLPSNGRNVQSLTLMESMGAASKTDRFERADVYSQTQGQASSAQAGALGDLFEYKLKERVTIRKNQSALVPIVQTELDADKVSLWSESLGISRPLRALWLNNTSGLTLDRGSFSVLDGNTFAGEGLLDPIRPGERRLISYATDLGLLVDNKMESEQLRVTRVRISRGIMTATSEIHEKRTYTARNEDSDPRMLVIEHPVRPDWKLAGSPEPEEKASGLYRFRFAVDPKKTEKFVVNEVKPLYNTYSISNVTTDQISLFLWQQSINSEIEKAFRGIVAQKGIVADLVAHIQSQQKTIDQIFTDQGRLRENMKALKGSPEEKALLQRYTKQLDDEETQLETGRKKLKETEIQRDKANAELEKMINDLQFDVAL